MFVERARPDRLSNRNCCYSDDKITAINEKDINQLTWNDYEAIFTISGCTAEYDQQLYYLPLALEYLKEHPGEGNEFVAGLVIFVASNQDRLKADDLLVDTLGELRACFHLWTSRFEVVHLDTVDYVKNSGAVSELLDALSTYGLVEIAEELVESWIELRRSPVASAWLLEFAYAERDGYARDAAEDAQLDRTPARRSPRISSIVMNDLLLQTAYDEIKNTIVASERSPSTYWPYLRKSLALMG